MTKMGHIVLAASMAVGMAGTQRMAAGQSTNLASEQVDGSFVEVKQVKDDLFAGTEKFAKDATDVTEVNLDPKMMGMVPAGSGVAGLAKKMKFVVIHTYSYDKPGMYNMDDVEVYRKKLEDGTWSCAIHVKEKSGTTDICSRTAADHEGIELVILTAEPKELTFIHMSGNVSLDELQQMVGSGSDSGGLKHR